MLIDSRYLQLGVSRDRLEQSTVLKFKELIGISFNHFIFNGFFIDLFFALFLEPVLPWHLLDWDIIFWLLWPRGKV